MRVLTFHIGRQHPDYTIAVNHCTETRRLYNSLTALNRENTAWKTNPQANTHISQALGVTPGYNNTSITDLEQNRKKAEASQNILLPQKVAQATARRVSATWKSYYAHKPSKQPGFAQNYTVTEYNKQAISTKSLKNGWLKPTGWKQGVNLPKNFNHNNIQAARCKPTPKGFTLELIYNETKTPPNTTSNNNYAGVDLGVNVLAAVAFTNGHQPLLYPGKPIKAINNYANKEVSKLPPGSKKKQLIWYKRNKRIDHYLHSASRLLADTIASTGVQTVVIGWNKGIKTGINIGKKNNQRFVQIPHKKFAQQLEYKLAEHNIQVIYTEESYTSKASAIDNDPLTKGVKTGTRIKRGLYKTQTGEHIHADINAAANIIRKHVPGLTISKGDVVSPLRIKPLAHS